jgi:hypothetical protein
VGLERGKLSLVSTIKELLERKSRLRPRKPRLWPQGIRRADYATPFYPQKLVLTSPTSGGCLAAIFARGLRPQRFIFVVCSTYILNLVDSWT